MPKHSNDESIEMIRLKSVKPLEEDINPIELVLSPMYTVYWKNLTYIVSRSAVDKAIGRAKRESPVPPDSRIILKAISGSMSSGQMTALMGPSGAGKTTLLECVIGKRHSGLSGQIMVKRRNSDVEINLAFLPQSGHYFEVLTVFETINYSSQLKNSLDMSYDHNGTTRLIIERLDLGHVQANVISSLSGSERKRLAIGIEIVSSPNFLVLDEPTTGLDSFAARKVMSTRRILSQF